MPTSTCGVFLINGSMLIIVSRSGRLANTAAAQKMRHHHHGRDDVGDIEHTGAAPHLQRRQQPAPGLEFVAIGERDRHAGDQHEGLRRVRKPEILVGQDFEDGARHMVDIDGQQSERAEHIYTRVAFRRDPAELAWSSTKGLKAAVVHAGNATPGAPLRFLPQGVISAKKRTEMRPVQSTFAGA